MVGIITVDDIIDVLEEEVTEDIHKMVGSIETYDDKLIKTSSLKSKGKIAKAYGLYARRNHFRFDYRIPLRILELALARLFIPLLWIWEEILEHNLQQ